MKALTFRGIRNIAFEEVAEPCIREPGDAIVRIMHTAICGSDMHIYHGRETGVDPGTIMGHEFEGEVVEAHPSVSRLKPGTRVVSPFTTNCGTCYFCGIGLTARCTHGALFGWVAGGTGLQGAQAEYIRIPHAEATLVPYPAAIPPQEALLAGDILSTGYYCASMADIRPGGTYAVVGCGPVGILTIMSAQILGAEKIYAIDRVPYRLDLASRLGAIPLSADKDPAGSILNENRGVGCDAVMEAVGSQAAQELAFRMVRPGGIISTVGVQTSDAFSFTPIEAYDKNIIFKIGRCPARHYMDVVLPLLEQKKIEASRIITHVLPLKEGIAAYELFDKKQDDCLKIVLSTG